MTPEEKLEEQWLDMLARLPKTFSRLATYERKKRNDTWRENEMASRTPSRSYYIHRSPDTACAVGLPYCITPDATPPKDSSRILILLATDEVDDMIMDLEADGHIVTRELV